MTGKTLTLAAVVLCLLSTASCSSLRKDAAIAPTVAATVVTTPAVVPSTPHAKKQPVETPHERRKRVDQEAAVKAYRAALAETDRLFLAGGTQAPTKTMKALLTSPYVDLVSEQLRRVNDSGLRGTRPSRIVYAGAQSWTTVTVHVKACEDETKSRLVDSRGQDKTPAGNRRFVQDYTLKKTSGGWKVADVSSRAVTSFRNYGCQA